MSSLLLVFVFGVCARITLLLLPGLSTFLSSRPEIITPATSWEKVIEGLHLSNQTGMLHNGDSYHGSSLMLAFASWLKSFPSIVENLVFISCDLISATALYKFANLFLQREFQLHNKKKKLYCKEASEILLSASSIQSVSLIMCIFYLLHPFMMVTCAVKSTLTISNMWISLFLYENIRLNVGLSTLFLALSTYESVYTAQLILAVILTLYKYNNDHSMVFCVVKSVTVFILWLSLIFGVAYAYENNFSSIFNHIVFILTVPDQTPNIGIFWYFFTEIFDHFQTFFIFVFQFHVVIFSFPLFFKLKSEPVLFAFATIGIISIFKSYPAFSDSVLWLSLLPLWFHTFRYLRFHIVGPVMLVTAIVLCPIMWNLWIFAQSANANFFFAATLVYNTAQVFILADVVRAHLEWLIHLKQGIKLQLPDSGEEARLRLMD